MSLVIFSEQIRLKTIREVQVATLTACSILLLFGIFDYFHNFSVLYYLLPLRAITIIILLIIAWLSRRSFNINILGIFGFSVVSISICVYYTIIVNTQALSFWESFTGANLSLSLIIIMSGLNMSWHLKYALTISVITICSFLATHLFFIEDNSGVILSTFLLISTSITACTFLKRSNNYALQHYKQEQQLRKSNEKLEQNIVKLKKAKKEQRLRKELQKLNSQLISLHKSRETFFSELSHEIRTPLTIILWKIGQIRENKNEEGVFLSEDEIELLDNYSKRLIYKFNNILDLAQYENEKQLYIGKYDSETLISNFVDEYQLTAKLKDINFHFQSSLNSSMQKKQINIHNIYCDKEELNKALFNLLHNSLKYVKENGNIQIFLFENTQHYIIEFKDDGIGISHKNIDNIMEEFSRTELNEIYTNQHYPQAPSSGLGLALVKQAILSHQGSISVRSNYIEDSPKKHGTTFSIKLPKGKKHFQNNPNVQFIKPRAKSLPSSKEKYLTIDTTTDIEKRFSVLIIDDNEELLELLEDAFVHKNYEVFTEEDGRAGLFRAEQEKPDLIITDLIMPGIAGIEFIRRLKKAQELTNIPVIILTGRLKEEKIPQDVRKMVDFVMQKPPSRQELLKKAQMLVGN